MSQGIELSPTPADRERWVPHLGSRVRIADRAALEAALRAPASAPRPLASQVLHGGASARVAGVRFDEARHPSYRLAGLPGEWQADWLRPIRD